MLTPWCGSCEVLGIRLILVPGFPLFSLVSPQSHSYNEPEKKVTPTLQKTRALHPGLIFLLHPGPVLIFMQPHWGWIQMLFLAIRLLLGV